MVLYISSLLGKKAVKSYCRRFILVIPHVLAGVIVDTTVFVPSCHCERELVWRMEEGWCGRRGWFSKPEMWRMVYGDGCVYCSQPGPSLTCTYKKLWRLRRLLICSLARKLARLEFIFPVWVRDKLRLHYKAICPIPVFYYFSALDEYIVYRQFSHALRQCVSSRYYSWCPICTRERLDVENAPQSGMDGNPRALK